MSARRLLVGVTPVIAVVAAALAPTNATATAASGTVPRVSPGSAYSVTLVTGDRVRVTPGANGQSGIHVTRGRGRSGVSFLVRHSKGGDLLVIPSDAVAKLAAGTLDPRLFDVTMLKSFGYDDDHRTDVPLILQGSGALHAKTMAPSFGTFVRQDKASTGAFWASLRRGTTSKSFARGDISKIWLSAKAHLDDTVTFPQIGGPTAWAAGYTGKGVKVAILDGGIDKTHPDFKNAILATKDFTGAANGTTDDDGHGTHTASTFVGRGVASSNGKYTGIAKDATIFVGKVCNVDGCDEANIIKGMDWAVAQKARVISMSVGSQVDDFPSPLTAEANKFATSNSLFVVAAGNVGRNQSVEAPADADSVLAVGSVDAHNNLSRFSSRGPRFHDATSFDFGMKPDITAPGENVIAARAQNLDPSQVLHPVDKWYQRESGTSMSTPLVAGAAALIVQQHPTYTPAQIKAVLMSTAKPTAGVSVYGQGAGRTDIGRAITQAVTADQGSLDFGFFAWPNTSAAAATKTLTYRNSSSSTVKLTITASMTVGGKAVPAGVLKLDHTSVTVSAHGSAAVKVTLDVKPGATGIYEGRINATSADAKNAVTTTLGAYKEVESYTLTMTALNSAGTVASADVQLQNTSTGEITYVTVDKAQQPVRLRAGGYVATVTTLEPDAYTDPPTRATVELRAIAMNQGRDVVFDARAGVAPTVTAAADADAVPFGDFTLNIGFHGPGADSGGVVFAPASTVRAVPTAANIPGAYFQLLTDLVKQGTGTAGQPGTPYAYHGQFTQNDSIPAPLSFRFDSTNTATVVNSFARQSGSESRWLTVGDTTDGITLASLPIGALTQRLDHFTVGTQWAKSFYQGTPDSDGAVDNTEGSLERAARAYTVGESLTDSWNLGPFVPGFGPVDTARSGDEITVTPAPLTDSAGHLGYATGPSNAGSMTLLRNGSKVGAASDLSLLDVNVAAADAAYELRVHSVRTTDWTALSTVVDASWKFHSTTTSASKSLPLSVVRFTPVLDASNNAPRSGSFAIPLTVQRIPGATTTSVSSVTVDVSYDGGKTWSAAAMSGSGSNRVATVTHPGTAGFASLRTTVTNADGTSLTETIIHAYGLA